jgi:hypothetical protein
MPKKILLILASIFLTFQSYKLIGIVNELQVDSWVAALIFAFLLTFFVTGIFAFLGFALPTQKLLPEPYYNIKSSGRLNKIFIVFKVNLFRKFLLVTFWKNRDKRKRYFNGRVDGINNLITQSKKAEFGHLIPFVLLSILALFFITKGFIKLSIVILLINCLVNWYPIVLQRHHRMRVTKILNKLK